MFQPFREKHLQDDETGAVSLVIFLPQVPAYCGTRWGGQRDRRAEMPAWFRRTGSPCRACNLMQEEHSARDTRFTAADRTATGSGNVLSGFLPPGTCLFILNLICHSNCSMPGEIRQGNSAFICVLDVFHTMVKIIV